MRYPVEMVTGVVASFGARSANKEIAAANTLTVDRRGVFRKYAGAVGLDKKKLFIQFFLFLGCLVLFVGKRNRLAFVAVLLDGINQVGLFGSLTFRW